MEDREIRELALSNLKIHKKSTVMIIMMIVASIEILLISSVFSGTVSKGIAALKDQSQLHILTASFREEKSLKETYDRYKDDSRVYEIGEGLMKRYGGVCTNMEELFDREQEVCYFFTRYIEYYHQYSDYDKELKTDEIILPRYMNMKPEGHWDYFDTGDFYDTSELVGKTISLEIRYEGKDMGAAPSMGVKEFKVVGIFDNVTAVHNGMNIYVSGETIREFEEFWGEDDEYNLYMVVSKLDDIDDIVNESQKFFYGAMLREEVDNWDYMADGVKLIGRVLFVFCIIYVIAMTTKSITRRMREFAIMKAVGYEQRIINRMLAYEIAITFAIGLAISLAASVVIVLVLNLVKYLVLPVINANLYVFALRLRHILFSIFVAAAAVIIAYGFSIDKITRTRLLRSLGGKKR